MKYGGDWARIEIFNSWFWISTQSHDSESWFGVRDIKQWPQEVELANHPIIQDPEPKFEPKIYTVNQNLWIETYKQEAQLILTNYLFEKTLWSQGKSVILLVFSFFNNSFIVRILRPQIVIFWLYFRFPNSSTFLLPMQCNHAVEDISSRRPQPPSMNKQTGWINEPTLSSESLLTSAHMERRGGLQSDYNCRVVA